MSRLLRKLTSWQDRHIEILVLGFILLLSLGYSIWYYLGDEAHDTFFALSGDDMHLTLLSLEASRGVLIPHHFWPPLQFWIKGLVMRFVPDFLHVPMLVNLTFSLLELVVLYFLAKELFGKPIIGFIAVIFVTFTPWHLWLSLSGLTEPIYHFFIILGVLASLRWFKTQQRKHLLIASLSFLFCGMLRFPSWAFSLVFSLLLLYHFALTLKHTGKIDGFVLLCAAIPWIFPLLWSAFMYAQYGDPFYPASMTRKYVLERFGMDSLWVRLIRHPRDLIGASPLVCILACYGVWRMWREQRSVAILLSLFWLSVFLPMIGFSLSGGTASNYPIRWVLANVILLSPVAGATIFYLGRRVPWGLALGIGLTLAACFWGIRSSSPRPQGLPQDVAQVSKYVSGLWEQEILVNDDRIMVEILYWDYLYLQLLSGRPDRVLFDRRPEAKIADGEIVMDDRVNPSLLREDEHILGQRLAKDEIKVVIAHSKFAIDNLERVAQRAYSNGRFVVFVVP